MFRYFFFYNREHELVWKALKRGRRNAQWHNHVPFNWNNIERETEGARREMSIIQLTVKLSSQFFRLLVLFDLLWYHCRRHRCCRHRSSRRALGIQFKQCHHNDANWHCCLSPLFNHIILKMPCDLWYVLQTIFYYYNILVAHSISLAAMLLLVPVLRNGNFFAWKLFVCMLLLLLLHADSLRWFSVCLLHMLYSLVCSLARSPFFLTFPMLPLHPLQKLCHRCVKRLVNSFPIGIIRTDFIWLQIFISSTKLDGNAIQILAKQKLFNGTSDK